MASATLPPAPKQHSLDLGSAAETATTTTAAFVRLPTDVIFEILSWLPANPLRRCRCVSKKWRDLISDPAFVTAHRSRAEPEPLLVALTGDSHATCLQLMDTEGTVVRAVSLAGQEHWTFRASLDGLACVTLGYNNSRIQIVDLAAGMTLKDLPTKPAVETSYTWSTCFGFGRTAQSCVYKVLHLYAYYRTCEVLTVGDGAQWRRTQRCPMMVRRRHYSSSGH
ncbi:F-box/LRR-repeat/kelch-repeat protein At2g27520-like [Aegilops tauschii subsp. strangulata]|uniref:F-box/LRR-repeat/kelch-repeat protein At2g27520-like n=1 Tax=Aegilops tauschii subsp. strangulata TaxID=200361 RepID=UPI003CC86F60